MARQYSGTAGRIENCQIGVFVTYVTAAGRSFLDRELYLPKSWIDDDDRRREAGIDDKITFLTKPQLARAMLARALAAGVPARWVTGDEVYGSDRRLRMWLEAEGVGHVMAAKSNEPLIGATGRHVFTQVRADVLADDVAEQDWQTLSAGDGAKGPRLYQWARVSIRPLRKKGVGHWLLIRRSLTDPSRRAFYGCYGRAATTLMNPPGSPAPAGRSKNASRPRNNETDFADPTRDSTVAVSPRPRRHRQHRHGVVPMAPPPSARSRKAARSSRSRCR
ncbi:IS701 family transposase [Frankia sp. QA3]|uniref:IS701 family transposase n=1 Tax=Frankia sp. QA3 TaxID=710111 RepID=UPI0018DED08F|nr:IS701 family transposase [Frankia sp. QA3]